MSTIDETLREAMLAHRAGRLTAAEVGYRRVLQQRPDDARALHFLGLLLFHQGDAGTAIEHLSRSLQVDASNARGWNALGGIFIASGRRAEARQAYQRSTEIAPAVAEGWYNLAICLRDDGEIDDAVAGLREAIARESDYFRAYEALAMLLYQLGQTGEAETIYSAWIARDPANSTARHMAAAASGENVPGRAADEYVRTLFDEAAASFDTRLGQLGYRSHQSVTTALIERLRSAQASPALAVLDAGCGTGLCGPLLRPHCQRLVGVDLSPKMLDRARVRDCYDELVAAELTAFMRSRAGAFDAIVSADTLVYFGELEEPFIAAHETLRPRGWLVCTLEALEPTVDADHRLEFHGRYAHRASYVRSVLERVGFAIESLAEETLRQEREQDVRGYLVVAQRS